MSFTSAMTPLNMSIPEPSYDIHQLSAMNMEQLSSVKKEIEDSLSTLFENLRKQNADMDTQLLTFDGFPRDDIDVVQVRLIRIRIIRLRNDLKLTLNVIETNLQNHFSNISHHTEVEQKIEDSDIPFALVSEVVASSPADSRGLKVGDRVLLFGGLHAGNHDQLKKVYKLVQESENKPIAVLVLRTIGSSEEKIPIELIPHRNWSGNGVLGCRLNPL